MSLILSSICQGILFGILSIGLFISFRILNIADMTTEGSFVLGASVCVSLIRVGVDPFTSCIIAFFMGSLAGLVTGILISYCKIPSLLAGILTMTALISINLRIMNSPNLNLLNYKTIFDYIHLKNEFNIIFIAIILNILIILCIYKFFKTEIGQAIIATGDNEKMAKSLGISTNNMTIFALMISNAIISFSGAIISQYNGFSDVNSGIGIIVVALSAIIIGEILFENLSFLKRLISIIYGSIIYRLILLLVLHLKIIKANDFKLISACLIVVFLSFPKIKENIRLKRRN
jgi:hypothetical protein